MKETTGRHRCAMDRLAREHECTVLVVAAHPDDETVGVGATLGSLLALRHRVEVLHVTDGAPRNAALRPSLRGRSVEDAGSIRRAEVEAALRAGGIDPDRVLEPPLGVPDQEVALAIPQVAHTIARRIETMRMDVIITHAYEGGHPDHDAVALAVHASVKLRTRMTTRPPPLLAEMSSYHAADGRLVTGSFIASSHCDALDEGRLDDAARERKRRMLTAFRTQADVLAMFGTEAEPLRCAPPYDFTRAPHAGVLHYERLPFGWTGEQWRKLAREALHELGLA